MLPSLLYQELINPQSSRKLLQHNPLNQTPTAGAGAATTDPYGGTDGLHTNVVMMLSILLCALICSVGLNSIIKCTLRCSTREANSDSSNPSDSSESENKGIKKKALKTFVVVNYSPYSSNLKLPGLGTECVICLSDFTPGDRLRLLPKCQHGFHTLCIDKWLNTHSSCPTCRHSLIQTCQKIVGCDQASSSHPDPPQPTIINMEPLDREDLVRSYRTNSSY